MSAYDLILIVLVAVAAFGAGYQIGRFRALTEAGSGGQPDDDGPLAGPRFDDGPSAPSRPRGAPPPASAGNASDSDAPSRPQNSNPVRRSTKPPPAAAGLVGKGSLGKDGDEPK